MDLLSLNFSYKTHYTSYLNYTIVSAIHRLAISFQKFKINIAYTSRKTCLIFMITGDIRWFTYFLTSSFIPYILWQYCSIFQKSVNCLLVNNFFFRKQILFANEGNRSLKLHVANNKFIDNSFLNTISDVIILPGNIELYISERNNI